MKFPKGKGFDVSAGLVISVILDDYEALIGTFLGEIEERHHHDDECCQPPKVEVKAILEDDPEFILLQLTCCFRKHDLEIPVGTIVAINVDQILFIVPGSLCEDCDKHDSDRPKVTLDPIQSKIKQK